MQDFNLTVHEKINHKKSKQSVLTNIFHMHLVTSSQSVFYNRKVTEQFSITQKRYQHSFRNTLKKWVSFL